MEHSIRKKLVDRFSEFLVINYEHYCEQHNLDANNTETIITYLVDQELIRPKTIKDYTIVHEFRHLLPQTKHKTETVALLADKFNISERAVWLVLKGGREFF
ncbi:MAG: hypothetical protein HC912_05770 [Saprospiraceae bacterium]|nr:hypothetical protein [Saprospiraceae bacterium]